LQIKKKPEKRKAVKKNILAIKVFNQLILQSYRTIASKAFQTITKNDFFFRLQIKKLKPK